MKIVHTALVGCLAAAAGCARTAADRPLMEPDESEERAERPPIAAPVEPATAIPEAPAEVPAEAPPARLPTITGVFIGDDLATACGLPLVPETFFEYDSAAVDPGDNALLRLVADCLATGPLQGRKVLLRGYNDPRGSRNYREQLAHARASSVGDFLAAAGVPPDDITVVAAGEADPAPEAPSEWPYERRVDIVLLPVE